MFKRLSRNARVGVLCLIAFLGMVGAAYAAVPLYRMFCQATGYDGTVRRAEKAPDKVLDRKVTIRFDTNVRGLPWDFAAEQVTQQIRIGDSGLAFFKVTNHGSKTIVGRAVYNVVPEQAGAYFQKLKCFCFDDQPIGPGETKEFPMAYFVSPDMASDPETKGVSDITLSYTFFPATDPKAAEKPAKPVSGLGEKAKAGL